MEAAGPNSVDGTTDEGEGGFFFFLMRPEQSTGAQ